MRKAAVVALLGLLVGCTADPEPPRTSPVPAPSSASVGPTATTTPTPPAPVAAAGTLVAVVRATSLELHRIDPATRAARLVRVLAPPRGATGVRDVALAAGAEPVVCASWQVGPSDPGETTPSVVACYAPAASTGQVLPGIDDAFDVAVTPDASRIAWSEQEMGGNQRITVAALSGGRVSGQRGFLARADLPDDGEGSFVGTGVQDLAWSSTSALLVSTAAESDDGPDLLRFRPESAGAKGWLDAGEQLLPPRSHTGYFAYDSVSSATATTAVALERGSYMDDQRPPDRVVVLRLADRAAVTVLGVAAAGREVQSASGSAAAAVYQTATGFDAPRTTYLRLAGDARGRVVTGLPADATDVVAQP